MIKPKKIKFVCPVKVSISSKEDYLTKLKPVLGQNQINLNTFITDFNKKTIFLNSDLMVRGVILKNQDKSYDVLVNYPPMNLVLNSLANEKNIPISVYQDIVISLDKFNDRAKKNFLSNYSKEDRYKIYSKLLLSFIISHKYNLIK